MVPACFLDTWESEKHVFRVWVDQVFPTEAAEGGSMAHHRNPIVKYNRKCPKKSPKIEKITFFDLFKYRF